MEMDSANVAARPPARMIANGSRRYRDATATPRITPRTFTSPSWLPRMKSDRRPGWACFSASASSFTRRQNANLVAIRWASVVGRVPADMMVCVFGSAEEGFSPLRRCARRMSAPVIPSWSLSLADAVRSGDPEAALRAGIAAAQAKAPPLEIARAATLAYGESVDVANREPLRGLMALSAAVRLTRNAGPRLKALPVLRAIGLAAADSKVP